MGIPLCKTLTFRQLISRLAFQQCTKTGGGNVYNDSGYKVSSSTFANRITHAGAESTFAGSYFNSRVTHRSKYLLPASLFGLCPALPCCFVPSRSYGRKMRQKPPKINTFQYSGDLRNLPELDKSMVLYKYRGLEDQIKGNEILEKLTSLEFATTTEYNEHRRQLIKDRIVELFGQDSELEQRIALVTLSIRQMIPYCIKYRQDKVNKIILLKRIAGRKNMLTNLREIDHQRFEWLLKELKIRYVIPRDKEEYKGWKTNLRVAKQEEVTKKQRQKLEELKEKFEAEKKVFFEHKANVMAQIEEDLTKFGLNKDHLINLIEADKAALKIKQQEEKYNMRIQQTTTTSRGK